MSATTTEPPAARRSRPPRGWCCRRSPGSPRVRGSCWSIPGNTSVTVTFHALASEGDTPPPDATLTIEPGSVDQVPPGFLEGIHGSAVEIRSSGGDILALAASTSLGVKGLSDVRAGHGRADPLTAGREAVMSAEPASGRRPERGSSLSSVFPSLSSGGTHHPVTRVWRPDGSRKTRQARSQRRRRGGDRGRHRAARPRRGVVRRISVRPGSSDRILPGVSIAGTDVGGHDAGRSHGGRRTRPRRNGSRRP